MMWDPHSRMPKLRGFQLGISLVADPSERILARVGFRNGTGWGKLIQGKEVTHL